MSNRKFRDLPIYTGDTTGTYLILNNSSQTTTHKVTKETLLDGYMTTGSVGTSIFHQSGSTYYTTSSILINNNLQISGTTTLGGNIVPLSPRGATLGTLEKPFADIFVSSGSINIQSDVLGSPNTSISNTAGNLLISAGGMELIGSASFVAQTGSFQYLSGSFKNVGTFTQEGATVITGALAISGSTTQIGNNNLLGNTTLSGSIIISGSQDAIGTNHLIGDQQLTGSLTVSGSTVQIGNNTLEGNTKLSGSVTITGSLYLTGSGGGGFINSHRILTDLDSGSFLTISGNTNNNVLTATGLSNNIQGESNLKFDGSNLNLTGSEIVNGNVIVTGSLIMDGTLQTNIATTVTNPSNYVLHQFLTSSYHGGTYAFSVHEDSTGKVTVYSNYIVSQGANAIASKIGNDSKLESGAGAPNPSFAVGFSGSYAQFKVTDTGTFSYRGIVQLY